MRIAILDDYQNAALASADWSRLPPGHDVTVFTDHVPDQDIEALRARLLPFDIVCIMRERTTMRIGLIERLPNLKLIALGGTGSSVIDIGLAAQRGVMVCGSDGRGVGAEEYTFGLILAMARGIVAENASVRAGGWQVGVGRELFGATLGIMGLGRLGPTVARFGLAFGMRVIAWSQNMNAAQAAAAGAELVTKDQLFQQSDFLTILTRLSERTRGLVGARELSLMKPDAYLINTSRGPIVQEQALLDALKAERIAGAALDVFDVEPLPADHPYRTAARLIVTPHMGYVTREMYRDFHGGQLEAILAFLAGKPINVLDASAEVHRPIGR